MEDRKLCFNDILLVPHYSTLGSRTAPSTATKIGSVKLKIPLISAAMDSITGKYMLVVMDKMGGLGILTRHINLEDREELDTQMKEVKWAKDQGAKNVGCAVGLKGEVAYKVQMLVNVGCNVICIDVAHGDHEKMYETIDSLSRLREKYQFTLMAGNVCTPQAVTKFAEHGVDAIKVGIGPGAACTTRIITGFGVPQFSAIQEADEARQEINIIIQGIHKRDGVSIIADGGLRTSGDMVKALWAGADACMIGYMLAGTNATPRIEGKRKYRGMSSRAASGRPDIAPEGIEINMEDKGKTENVIEEYVKGIKSGLAMGGATNFKELLPRRS
jgi:IMP dehydrogenase